MVSLASQDSERISSTKHLFPALTMKRNDKGRWIEKCLFLFKDYEEKVPQFLTTIGVV